MHGTIQEKIEALFKKNRVKIAVIDSGLGGLAICAELERALRENPLFRKVSLIYFNVWPEQAYGYNSLDSMSERVGVFDRALEGVNTYSPDLMMIACNTLSAIYDRTPFSLHTTIPVVDIIEFGVDLIYNGLIKTPDSQVLILGTRTTISEKVHQRMLIRKGIDVQRIRTQACHGVATAIEKNPQGEVTIGLIEEYMRAASEKISREQPLLAALCCTHFAYSGNIFKEKLAMNVSTDIELLDPNTRMSDFLFGLASQDRFPGADSKVKVISKIVLEDMKINSIAGIVKSVSKKSADALVDYTYRPDLFEVWGC